MPYCVQLKDDSETHKLYPRTLTHCVFDENGDNLETLLKNIADMRTVDEKLEEVKDTILSGSNLYAELLSLATEEKIHLYYSDDDAPTLYSEGFWYTTSQNSLYRYNGIEWRKIENQRLIQAFQSINPEGSTMNLVIYIQDYTPIDTCNCGDLWVADRLYRHTGEYWEEAESILLGGTNCIQYSKEYDPTTCDKWVDKSNTSCDSKVYEITEEGFGVQRIEGAGDIVAQSIRLKPATYYCMSAYIKSENPQKPATLRATIDTNYGSIETQSFETNEEISSEYTRYYFVFRTYSTCRYIMPRFESKSNNPYLIYGLQVEEGTEPTEWNPSQQDIVDRLKEFTRIARDPITIYYTSPQANKVKDRDLWYIREEESISQRIDGNWVPVTTKNLLTSIDAINPSNQEVIHIYSQDIEPTKPSEGDVWINPTEGNTVNRWYSKYDSWNLVDLTQVELSPEYVANKVNESKMFKDKDGNTLIDRLRNAETKVSPESIIQTVTESIEYKNSIGEFSQISAAARYSEDSAIRVYYTDDTPNTTNNGDLWVSHNTLMRYLTKWLPVQDESLLDLLLSVYDAQAIRSDRYITFYVQSVRPTSGIGIGDFWLDSSNGDKVYRYTVDFVWKALKNSKLATDVSKIQQQSDKIELRVDGLSSYFDTEGSIQTGLKTGSSVIILEDEVNITTEKFNIQIPSETEEYESSSELTVNKDGVHTKFLTVEDMECPSVLKKYTGKTIFNNVTSLPEIAFNLNYKVLEDDIVINIPSGSTIDQRLSFEGIIGSGTITVNGDWTSAGTYNGSGSYITSGVSTTGCGVKITFNKIYSKFERSRSLYVLYNECDAPSSFEVSITKEYTATAIDTYRANGWVGKSDSFYQGYIDTELFGCIWFQSIAIPANSEILDARLILGRYSNYGSSSSVSVTVYSSSATNTSEELILSTEYSAAPSIKYGSQVELDVKNILPDVLSRGCFVVYNRENTLQTGKDTSINYAKFYGIGTEWVPTLSITYKESTPATSETSYQTDINNLYQSMNLIDAIYPVGSLYMSMQDINPNTHFSNTTWERVKDTMIVGAGDTYEAGTLGELYTVKSSGSATSTLPYLSVYVWKRVE